MEHTRPYGPGNLPTDNYVCRDENALSASRDADLRLRVNGRKKRPDSDVL